MDRKKPLRTRLPLMGLARAAEESSFDDAGLPTGSGWEDVEVLGVTDENAYALRITGDGLEPIYRDGDIVVVSPNSRTHVGDRVVARLVGGELLIHELRRRTADEITLAPLSQTQPARVVPVDGIVWMARILWASQ